MLLPDKWQKIIRPRAISLLEKWVERRTTNGLRSGYLPQEEERIVIEKSRDKNGKLQLETKILKGVVGQYSTAPREWTDTDELGIVLLKLPYLDQLVILAAVDPFQEVSGPERWKKFLRKSKIFKQFTYDEMLIKALTKFQQELAKRRIVRKMSKEKELHGWEEIAAYLHRSVPTVRKLAREHRAPITLMGNMPYTTEEKLDYWKDNILGPYWKERPEGYREK